MSELYDEVTDEVSGGKFYRPRLAHVHPDMLWSPDEVADPETPAEETILDEAKRLVDGARGGDYGHPLDDFDALGRFWGAILTRYYEGLGIDRRIDDLPAETVALMLAAIKINREAARSRRDNIVDLAGYTYTIELIQKRRGDGTEGTAR